MTTALADAPVSGSSTKTGIAAAALIGLSLIVVAGHVQSQTLHDAAHDTRHATGFPCH